MAMHPQMKCMHTALAMGFVLDESIVRIAIIVEKLMIAYEYSAQCVCTLTGHR